MSRMNAYHLIIRYPALRSYIIECYNGGFEEDLYDLLLGLEVEHAPAYAL